jgi:hypothetical protein
MHVVMPSWRWLDHLAPMRVTTSVCSIHCNPGSNLMHMYSSKKNTIISLFLPVPFLSIWAPSCRLLMPTIFQYMLRSRKSHPRAASKWRCWASTGLGSERPVRRWARLGRGQPSTPTGQRARVGVGMDGLGRPRASEAARLSHLSLENVSGTEQQVAGRERGANRGQPCHYRLPSPPNGPSNGVPLTSSRVPVLASPSP